MPKFFLMSSYISRCSLLRVEEPASARGLLLADPAPAAGGYQPVRHVGQCIAHHRKRGHVLPEIVAIHFVKRVSFGMMPVEVVRAHGPLAEPGDVIYFSPLLFKR